jgi:hypothetical protein
MKTKNDYAMFFQGYLEALTDIDGDQREFGANVRMFKSNKKNHLQDIEKHFGFRESLTVINSKKFRNFYSVERILGDLLFVNLFNGAKIPKESIDSFRSYVIFHLLDYIDFSFNDVTYRLGKKKKFEIIQVKGERVNYIFLVMSAEGKKLVISFYRNKKYFSDEKFMQWYDDIIKKEEEIYIASIKERGVSNANIHSFIFERYNKEDILETAYKIFICSEVESKAINKICTDEKLKLSDVIKLFRQGLEDVHLEHYKTPEEVARLYICSNLIKAGLKRKYHFQERFDGMMEIVGEYNQKFQNKKSLKKYKKNNKFGYAISPNVHKILSSFKKILDTFDKDTDIETALKKAYKKDEIADVWKEMIQKIKPILNI